jgi:hypothetical protein
MLEEQCRGVFEKACQEVIDKHTQLVRLKGGWPRPKNEFENYFKWDDKYYIWDGWLVKKVSDSRKDNIIRDAFLYFVHGEKLRDAYIKQKYGDLENAMRQTVKFSVLFNTFLEDFAYRRNKFMEQTNDLLNIKKGELKRQGKLPQSHGGVANLLKVLTQTMKAQGSSIKTIAKVQYTICIQAGIYVPEEFITDVLVSANIENGGLK